MEGSIEQARSEIVAVHKAWWEANMGLRIPEMSACFPSGDNYLMFNLNGHPYFGIDEKVKLWEFYADQLEIPELPDIRIMKLEIHGDMAWLACEGLFPIREIGAEGTAAELLEVGESVVHVPLRATEIYHRDDGAGNPVWTMWHFNSSPLPPEDEPRPAFGDTASDRGLGWNHWGEPERAVGAAGS